jgi:hypothetical protein
MRWRRCERSDAGSEESLVRPIDETGVTGQGQRGPFAEDFVSGLLRYCARSVPQIQVPLPPGPSLCFQRLMDTRRAKYLIIRYLTRKYLTVLDLAFAAGHSGLTNSTLGLSLLLSASDSIWRSCPACRTRDFDAEIRSFKKALLCNSIVRWDGLMDCKTAIRFTSTW